MPPPKGKKPAPKKAAAPKGSGAAVLEALGLTPGSAPAARAPRPASFQFGASKEERLARVDEILATAGLDYHTLKGKHARVHDIPPIITTGSLKLDLALGIGGFPLCRIVEIFGAEGCGKTTLALQVVAAVQRLGGTAAFIDAEHALDTSYAEALGVQLDELLLKQPDNGEEALNDVVALASKVNVIVVDSVAAIVPKSELEGTIGGGQPGSQARLMSQSMRVMTPVIGKHPVLVIFINQTREKINTGGFGGSPKTTSGGNALKFYASIRVEITRIGQVTEGSEIVGHRVKFKVLKNKLAPPFKVVETDLIYGKGISREYESVEIGLASGFLERSGSWYSVKGERIGQGRVFAAYYMAEHPEVMDEIRAHAMAAGLQITSTTEAHD